MKVLLIHLPYYRGQQWSLPLGLAYIASVLLQAGLEVDVLDINLLKLKKQYSPDILFKKLKNNSYFFIGFGAVFFDFSYFQRLSTEIRNICPDTFQVIGGQWASRLAELLVESTSVDAVVLGEGEEVILEIVDYLRAGKPVSELRYVHARGKPYVHEFALVQDLDEVPQPARHLFDIKQHRVETWLNDPMLYFSTIVATRGCSRKCVFCNPLGGRKLRTRSAENIIDEMEGLYREYGIKYFRFNDEVFLGSNRKILDFCNALEKSGLKITFAIWSWSTNLNEETIGRLRDVGCNAIQVGIESGSPYILEQMNKVQNLQSVKKTVRLISDYGIRCGSGWLTGTPGETKETLQETKNLIMELNKIYNFTIPRISTIKFLVGSPLYNMAKERSSFTDLEFIADSDANQMFKFVNLTGLDTAEYIDAVDNINRELKQDFYSQNNRIIRRLLLTDQIDYKNLLRTFAIKDVSAVMKKFGYVMADNLSALLSKFKHIVDRGITA